MSVWFLTGELSMFNRQAYNKLRVSDSSKHVSGNHNLRNVGPDT